MHYLDQLKKERIERDATRQQNLHELVARYGSIRALAIAISRSPNQIGEMLNGRPFIYVYVSDHGEYLGHDGIWGRAALGESQFSYHETDGSRVGMFVLTSPQFDETHPHFAQALSQLREHATMSVGHEHIFHTLLGMFGISSPYYDAKLDLCSPAAQPYSGPKPARVD